MTEQPSLPLAGVRRSAVDQSAVDQSATGRFTLPYPTSFPVALFPIALLACLWAVLAAPMAAQDVDGEPSDPMIETEIEIESDETDTDKAFRDEIVVSAHRRELARGTVGSSVTVFDAEEIERLGVVDVAELLRTAPGVEVARTGGPGSVTSAFVRGGESYHTLLLIDGLRANDNTTGGFDLADLKIDNVERVEILRGPQGTLYGSEALAGVISITTRRGRGPLRAWGAIEGGSHDLRHVRAGVSGGDERFDYSVSFADLETDSVSSASEAAGNTENDPYENFTATGRAGVALGVGRLEATLRRAEGDVGLDGFAFPVGPVDDLDYVQLRDTTTGGLEWSADLGERWSATLLAGAHRVELRGEDPTDPVNEFAIDTETRELSAQADVRLNGRDAAGGLLTFGYRFEERAAENVGSFDESTDLQALFVQGEWSIAERHHLSASVRRDEVAGVLGAEDIDETTARVTLSSILAEPLRFHGSYGTGFRAPTLNEFFFPGFGNPDLSPETSEGFDLGLEAIFDDGRLVGDVTYFDNRFEDLILFTFPGGFQNVAEATAEGFEASLDWRAGQRFDLRASYTRTDSENVATGAALARRPKHRGVVSASWRPSDGLRGTLTVLSVRDRVDTDGAIMDDYERVDLSAETRLRGRWWATLRVENLLDEDYVEVPGFTTPGATFRLGLRLDR